MARLRWLFAHFINFRCPRAICTVLLDPRDPLLHSERTQGCTADLDYWKGEVFAYVGRNQNLKDLKDRLRSHQPSQVEQIDGFNTQSLETCKWTRSVRNDPRDHPVIIFFAPKHHHGLIKTTRDVLDTLFCAGHADL